MILVAQAVILAAAGAPIRRERGDSCYHYAPAVAALTGRLIQRTLPGPPNYQSIARGDRPQLVDLLILDAPICTIPDYKKDSPNTDGFQGQDTIQVRRAAATWNDVRRLTGQRVTVVGTLAEWALGQDHTPVLIDPTSVRAVDLRTRP